MRYNPETERGLNIDEIAAQCRAAILKTEPQPQPQNADLYSEILAFAFWENDVLVCA